MIYYRACNDSEYTICNELYTPGELKHKFRVLSGAIDTKKDVIPLIIQPQYAPELKTRVIFKRCSIPSAKTFINFGCRFAISGVGSPGRC